VSGERKRNGNGRAGNAREMKEWKDGI